MTLFYDCRVIQSGLFLDVLFGRQIDTQMYHAWLKLGIKRAFNICAKIPLVTFGEIIKEVRHIWVSQLPWSEEQGGSYATFWPPYHFN